VKKFAVSLVIRSLSLTLDDLSSLLGRRPSGGSHSKGDPHRSGTTWTETLWRLDSDAPNIASLDQHLENLAIQFPAKELIPRLSENCEVCVDIVVFFDTVDVSAHLSALDITIVNSYGAALDVTCYPSTFGET
jgi:hypothetical protein